MCIELSYSMQAQGNDKLRSIATQQTERQCIKIRYRKKYISILASAVNQKNKTKNTSTDCVKKKNMSRNSIQMQLVH